MEDYFVGCDCLGSEDEMCDMREEIVGAEAPADQGPFVTIHVKNVPELVKQQGGGAGAAAFSLLPQTIQNTVYSKMAEEIGNGMKAKGVIADIKVVSNMPAVGGSPKDFAVGALVGASAFGLVFGLVKLFKK